MICNTCKADKDESFFRIRSDNGKRDKKCKTCKAEYGKKYYQKNREKFITYQRENYRDNAADRRKQKVEYGKTIAGVGVRKKAGTKWRGKQKNKTKIKAQRAVNKSILLGSIPKASEVACKKCGVQAHHYHHWSYLKENWLDVIPLCRICHKAEHKRLRDEGIEL